MDPRISAMSAELRRAELAAEAAENRRVREPREEESPRPVAQPRPVRRAATA